MWTTEEAWCAVLETLNTLPTSKETRNQTTELERKTGQTGPFVLSPKAGELERSCLGISTSQSERLRDQVATQMIVKEPLNLPLPEWARQLRVTSESFRRFSTRKPDATALLVSCLSRSLIGLTRPH